MATLRTVLPRLRPFRSFQTFTLRPQLQSQLRLSHSQPLSRSLLKWRAPPRRTYFSRNGPKAESRPSDSTPHLGSPPPTPTLSQRLKTLTKQYGWLALGVYLGLSVLDFPFCFLAVRTLGAERIGKWEQAVIDKFWDFVPFQRKQTEKESELQVIGAAAEREGSNVVIHEHSSETASIWTQLALAYAVHKSLIFFRVPLTAAVLPKVARTLRSWGWKVGHKPA